MRGPTFDSSEDGKDALATVHGISRALIDKLFDKTDEVAPKLLEEYGVEEGVDIDVVREYLKIAFCEDIAWMAATSAAHPPVKPVIEELGTTINSRLWGANTSL